MPPVLGHGSRALRARPAKRARVGCSPERRVEDIAGVLKDAFMSPSVLKDAFRTVRLS